MITDVQTHIPSTASPPEAVSSLTESTRFDERWAAWQAKGVAHDRAVRRKLGAVVSVLLILAAVLCAFLGR
jgi:hypothetical protein